MVRQQGQGAEDGVCEQETELWVFLILRATSNISHIVSRHAGETPNDVALSPPAELHHDKRTSVPSLCHIFTS